MARYNEHGQELPDQTPVEWPARFQRPLSLRDEIKRFIRSEMSAQAEMSGSESFDEADDFDVDDEDGDLVSPYEMTEMQEEAAFRDASDLAKPEPPAPPAKPVVPNAEVVNPAPQFGGVTPPEKAT